jgi:hypothetical protein
MTKLAAASDSEPCPAQGVKSLGAIRADTFLFLDETGFDEKSSYAAVGCIIVDQPQPIRDSILALRDQCLHDPFLALHSKAVRELESHGFHYSGDHPEVRQRFIELLMKVTFEAYVCLTKKPSPFDHAACYDRLFGRLLFERLRANRHRGVHICFEQTDSRRLRRLEASRSIVARCVKEISKDRAGPPVAWTIDTGDKTEPCLAVADYVTAIVRHYFEPREREGSTLASVNLARIRSKVRVVHDIGTDVFFRRGNPLP